MAEAVVQLVFLALIILMIVSGWKVFEKAGEAGWKTLIPFYNMVVYLKVCGRPGWWLILMFIPIVSLIAFVLPFDLAKRFGRGGGFGVGLLFLPFVFMPMLAFGEATYQRQIEQA